MQNRFNDTLLTMAEIALITIVFGWGYLIVSENYYTPEQIKYMYAREEYGKYLEKFYANQERHQQEFEKIKQLKIDSVENDCDKKLQIINTEKYRLLDSLAVYHYAIDSIYKSNRDTFRMHPYDYKIDSVSKLLQSERDNYRITRDMANRVNDSIRGLQLSKKQPMQLTAFLARRNIQAK